MPNRQTFVMNRNVPSLTAWLWWLTLLILITGGAVYYLFRVSNGSGAEMKQAESLTIAVTSILAGICVISATSNWWMKR